MVNGYSIQNVRRQMNANGCVYGTLLSQMLIRITNFKYSKMKKTKNEQQCVIHDVIHSAVNIENFLKENDFQLDTYYKTNKRYRKEITDCQTLYVRIYSDINKIVDVEYEHKALTKFENEGIISFQTIENIEQLKHLLEALK